MDGPGPPTAKGSDLAQLIATTELLVQPGRAKLKAFDVSRLPAQCEADIPDLVNEFHNGRVQGVLPILCWQGQVQPHRPQASSTLSQQHWG